MADVDTSVIRRNCESYMRYEDADVILSLCDEVDHLRAERDRYNAESNQLNDEVIGLEARLAAVAALHVEHGRLFPGQCRCLGCQMAAAARGEGDRPAATRERATARALPGTRMDALRLEADRLDHSGEGDRG